MLKRTWIRLDKDHYTRDSVERVYSFRAGMSKLFHRGPCGCRQEHTGPDSFFLLIGVFRQLIYKTIMTSFYKLFSTHMHEGERFVLFISLYWGCALNEHFEYTNVNLTTSALKKGHLSNLHHSESLSSSSIFCELSDGFRRPLSFVRTCRSLTERMRISMASMVLSSRGVVENHIGLLGTQQRSGRR